MNNPKDVLESIARRSHPASCRCNTHMFASFMSRLRDVSGECNCFVGDAKAAIPVAELHQQAVELLEEEQQNMECGIWIRKESERRQRYEKVGALLSQIKALKCTPQK